MTKRRFVTLPPLGALLVCSLATTGCGLADEATDGEEEGLEHLSDALEEGLPPIRDSESSEERLTMGGKTFVLARSTRTGRLDSYDDGNKRAAGAGDPAMSICPPVPADLGAISSCFFRIHGRNYGDDGYAGNPEPNSKGWEPSNSKLHREPGCYKVISEATLFESDANPKVLFTNRVAISFCLDVTYDLKAGCANGLKKKCRKNEGTYFLGAPKAESEQQFDPAWMDLPTLLEWSPLQVKDHEDNVTGGTWNWNACGLVSFPGFGVPYPVGKNGSFGGLKAGPPPSGKLRKGFTYPPTVLFRSFESNGGLSYTELVDGKPRNLWGRLYPAGLRVYANGAVQSWGGPRNAQPFPGKAWASPPVPPALLPVRAHKCTNRGTVVQ